MTYYQGLTLDDRSKHLDAAVFTADNYKSEAAIIEAYSIAYKMRDDGKITSEQCYEIHEKLDSFTGLFTQKIFQEIIGSVCGIPKPKKSEPKKKIDKAMLSKVCKLANRLAAKGNDRSAAFVQAWAIMKAGSVSFPVRGYT